MKKKSKLLSISALALVVVSTIIFSNTKAEGVNGTVKYVNSPAKIIGYNNFNEMDNSAKLILKGAKKQVIKTILNKDSNGDIISYGTQSAIEVNKIYKSNNVKIKDGSTIIVQENGAVDRTETSTNIYGIEGYQLMNENEEYLLFLDESLTDPNVYFVEGVYYGKVPLQETKKSKILKSDAADIQDLEYQGENKSTAKLEQFFTEALKKYGN